MTNLHFSPRATWTLGLPTALDLLLAVGLTLLSAGCGSGAQAAGPGEANTESVPRPDVLIVAVDGLSLGDIGIFGGNLATTAGFDRLAEEGTVYVDGFSPSPWADESLAALLSGRRAAHLDGGPWTPSLAETLQHDGYRTALVLGHEQHLPDMLAPGSAGRSSDEGNAANATTVEASSLTTEAAAVPGFESTLLPEDAASISGARADEVTDTALAWLKQVSGPVLMVATYGDPRPPHHLYAGLVPAADVPYDGPVSAGLSHAELLRCCDDFTDDDHARLAELHGSEVAMVDTQFMRLAGAVIARRPTPPILIVVGLRPAALGEGGRYGLVPSFDPAALQVPILIRFPEPMAGTPEETAALVVALRGDVEVPATLTDVGPTLLDSLGFEPRYDIDGRSLFPGTRLRGNDGILGLTQKGIRGGCLISGDRAVSIEFAPDALHYYRRPSSAEPFAEMPVPTSEELDLAKRVKSQVESLGIR